MNPTRLARLQALLLLLVLTSAWLPASAAAPDDAQPRGVWPLVPTPRLVRGFDPPSDAYSAGHRGVDLAGVAGQQVRSALPGTVTYAGRLAGRGVVVVGHGATRTTYEPVTATVRVGQQVTAGEPIGRLELVGSHCFPAGCLHWGWLRGEVYLDPLELVGARPVRLLPLHRLAPRPPSAGATSGGPPRLLPAYAGWRPLLAVLTLVDGLADRPSATGPW